MAVHVGTKVTQAGGETVRLRGFSDLGPHAFTVPKGEEVLSNGPTAASTAFNHGRMDGFVRAQSANRQERASVVHAYRSCDARAVARLARRGVVFDRYFSSYLAGSLPNTLSLVAGDAYGRDQGSSADFTGSVAQRHPHGVR